MSNAAAKKVPDTITQWVTFALGDEKYGIEVMQVQEVLRLSEIAPVPGAPHYVLGIINLRGNVVTVIDARARFALPASTPGDASRIIIIETRGQVVGILVDSVAEVVETSESEIESAPHVGTDDSSRFIRGVCAREDELLVLVELDKLLGSEDWSAGAAD